MLESVNELISSVVGSPWAYLAVFVVCAVDAFFPLVPSETSVIAAAAVAASGGQRLAWIVVVAFLGAFAGDHVAYALGRSLGRSGTNRVMRGERGRAAHAWGERVLRTRGGLVIVALRFIPGGRTATTFTAGTLRYPLRRFAAFDALAAGLWATYSGLLGYWAGAAFKGNHLLAVTVGIAVSVVIGLLVEVGRFVIRRRRDARALSCREQPEDGMVGRVG